MKTNMAWYFLPLLLIVIAGIYLFIQASQRKWGEVVLLPGETIIYEQEKTDLQSARAKNFDTTTKGLFLRATNKRFFFLLPNKKNIFLILDFTSAQQNTAKENIDKAVIHVDRQTMKFTQENEKNFLQVEGKNFMGVNLQYKFELKEKIRIEN